MSASSQQTRDAAGDIVSSAEQLRETAKQLRVLVSQFTVAT